MQIGLKMKSDSRLEICREILTRGNERVQLLEKWWESLKGTSWEEPIEASQGQVMDHQKKLYKHVHKLVLTNKKMSKESINKAKFHGGLTSVHAIRKAMST
jgi:hypothetical protein